MLNLTGEGRGNGCAIRLRLTWGFQPIPTPITRSPGFYSHGELRGGGPVTDPAFKRPGFRNFYLPERRDPFTGLRTVGLA